MAGAMQVNPDDLEDVPTTAMTVRPEDLADVTPPERSTGQKIARTAGLAARDVGMGIASVPLMIGDAANAALNFIPATINKVAGTNIPGLPSASGAAERFATRAGLPEAETPGERIMSDALRATAAAPATILGGGAMATRAASPAVKRLGAMLSDAPTTQILAGTGSGTGAGVAKETYPDSTVAPLLGGLAGGIGVPTVAAIVESAKRAGKAFLEPFTGKGQKRIAGGVLREASGTPQTLDAQLDQVLQQPQIVAGSAPTTAEILRDPGLAVLERGAKQGTPGAAASFSQREAERAGARRTALEGVEAGGPGGAEAVATSVRGTRDQFQAMTDQIINRARGNAERLIATMGDDVSPEAAGAVMRREFDQAYGEIRQRVGTAYRAIDPNGETAVPVGPLAVSVGETAHQFFGNAPSGIPAVLNPILERLAQGRSTPMTVAQLEGISKEASGIAGKARVAGDRPLAAAAEHIVEDVRNHIDDAAAQVTGVSPETAQAIRDARALRAEQGTRFEQGANKPLTKTKAFGEEAIAESAIPANYLRRGKGGAEAAEAYVQSMGGRPQAIEALRNHAATELREYAARPDGTIDPARWRRWMDDRGGALAAFPDVRRDFADAGRATAMVDRLVGLQARTLDQFEKSAAGYFLKKNPEDAVSAILKSDNSEALMREAVNQMRRDPAALSGLRRAVRDIAVKGAETTALDVADNPIMSTAKMVNFVRDNRKALGALYTPQQLDVMERVAADMQSQQWPLNAGRTAGSPTHQNATTAGFISKASNGLIDPASPLWRGTGGRFLGWLYKVPEQQVQQLLADAMLDPKIARDMVAAATPANVRNLSTILRERAIASGISMTTPTGADRDEPKPLKIEIRPDRRRSFPGAAEAATVDGYADGGSVKKKDRTVSEIVSEAIRDASDRFLGVDPATGEADYWKRGGLAGMLGMEPWYNAPPQEIAEGFVGSITPAKGAALLKGASKPIRAYHGSPHDFLPERLVRGQGGAEEYLVGTPNRLPDIPQGYEPIQDFPLGRFRADKVGTGEGAQAYGHGAAYLAGNEGVARSYRDALAPRLAQDPKFWKDVNLPESLMKDEFKRYYALGDKMRQNGNLPADEMAAWRELHARKQAYDSAVEAAKPTGRMYEVDIHADPSRFLDWDKPLSGQSEAVRRVANEVAPIPRPPTPGDVIFTQTPMPDGRVQIFAPKGISMGFFPPEEAAEAVRNFTTGYMRRYEMPSPDLYGSGLWDRGSQATSPRKLSQTLSDAGIPGIKYLDQGSRGSGTGTSNYVVFDDKLIEILKKYGIAGLVGGGAASALPSPAEARDRKKSRRTSREP